MKEVSLFIGTKNNAVQFLMERESEQKEELTNVCSINSCGMSVQPTDSAQLNVKEKRDRSELSKLTELRLKKKIEMELEKEQQQQLLRELSRGYYEDEEVKCSISRADSLPQENVDLKKLDEEDHPERKIPDIPENKRVRDFLRSMPLTGHGAAFGKEIRVVQCYRCKCYGHRAGDPECKYTTTGDLGQELQRRVREDPMTFFRKIDEEKPKESKKW
ncbi:hypothetical protein JH06_0335 [Blastocystis sp. subtype 4]|uniref:hypothetical protein n=1 Tax=Blastocystis sp. subtype 4 TaxID=944170 RepID=UPI000711BE7F|nr:hypothetical protein JH06_0335 [Blastocystis sp. subtype 4]KNB46578.1 hypothetical protein JH06_0335 [Blastocystis sp. subtype 4]|eukprot:XP_014530021.1 hypothetical protein JH06_0335 [Blastocystis sp. subtype 4]